MATGFHSYPPLLLASKSPRRRHLLEAAGYTFEVFTRFVEETHPPDLSPEAVPRYLAELKSQAYTKEAAQQLVITADTVVILAGELIGKPRDLADAEGLLHRLSGTTHTVISGVCLAYRGEFHTFEEITCVTFAKLDPAEIKAYVKAAQPLDKAGGYGIQDRIGLRGVTGIQGDYYNVMGFPVARFTQELPRFLERVAVVPFNAAT